MILTKNYKVGNNILSKSLSILNNKISLNLLNLSLPSKLIAKNSCSTQHLIVVWTIVKLEILSNIATKIFNNNQIMGVLSTHALEIGMLSCFWCSADYTTTETWSKWGCTMARDMYHKMKTIIFYINANPWIPVHTSVELRCFYLKRNA